MACHLSRFSSAVAVVVAVALFLSCVAHAQTTTAAPCNIANCYTCATGNANQCLSCVPGMVVSSTGYCMVPGTCFVTGCAQCVSNNDWACQTCMSGYALTAVSGCAKNGRNAAAGLPSLATAVLAMLASALLLSF